jgi:TPR repeat protein
MFIMWSNLKSVLYLLLAIASFNTLAENTVPLDIQPDIQKENISPSSPQASESGPLNTYQTALNYLLGRNGTEKSAEKAAELFKKLAEQNWSSAQHMLGNMYLRGKGVEKNDLLAYKWLSLASKNNMQLAKAIHTKRQQLYENLQNNLSLQSLSKVETWIAEWKPTNDGAQLNQKDSI